MALENKFASVMSKKTNNELIGIVTINKENYQAEAIEAAKIEIKNRNLSDTQIEKANRINEKKVAEIQKKAEEPLGGEYKILLLFLPIRAISLSVYYENKGYDLKAKEAIRWCYYGVAFWAFIILLINCF
jgi:hypothetical protein